MTRVCLWMKRKSLDIFIYLKRLFDAKYWCAVLLRRLWKLACCRWNTGMFFKYALGPSGLEIFKLQAQPWIPTAKFRFGIHFGI